MKCNIMFTTRQAKSRHLLKSCTNQDTLSCDNLEQDNTFILNEELQKENNELHKENNELLKSFNELNNKFSELLKQCKIHPKTLQKINNTLVNTGTINNTVNIIKFGCEDLTKILSQSEILKILNKKMCSLEESIKLIHFNDMRPECKNIYITNLKDQYAYIYNGTKFIAVLKSDMLEELVDNHFENIEYSADEYKEKLQPKTIEVLEKFIDKMNNDDEEFMDNDHKKLYPNYKSYNINRIKLLIYNMSDKKTNIVNVICD